ncbi:MAG: DUF3089 domain-containing protein [Alphaproteobacteria bacterium]|nr:DUF3089 domain-containing protein [Alphaproteobacteria bacterium]
MASFLMLAAAAGIVAVAAAPEELVRMWAKPGHAIDRSIRLAPPNFAEIDSWWSRPGLNVAASKNADLFFVHGTSYFGNRRWNDGIEAESGDWRLTTIALPAMTAPFRDCCRIFAPRYRQANLAAFLSTGTDSRAALNMAYEDVLAAFKWYLDHANDGRPIVLAGHSQGSLHLQRLVEDVSSDARFRDRLVVAYLVGYPARLPVPGNVPVCGTANEIGCFVAWNTLGIGGAAERWRHRVVVWTGTAYAPASGRKRVCVNPLTWSRDGAVASPSDHRGGRLVPLSNAVHPSLVSARCHDGLLYVSRPSHPAYAVLRLPGRDYHVMEYNLFHEDIRLNVAERLAAMRARPRSRTDSNAESVAGLLIRSRGSPWPGPK